MYRTLPYVASLSFANVNIEGKTHRGFHRNQPHRRLRVWKVDDSHTSVTFDALLTFAREIVDVSTNANYQGCIIRLTCCSSQLSTQIWRSD